MSEAWSRALRSPSASSRPRSQRSGDVCATSPDQVAMKPTFAGHRVATLVLAGTLALWLVIEFRQALNRRAEATNTDRGSLTFLRVCVLAGAVLAAFASRVTAAAFPYGPGIFGVSLAVIWAGIGLRWWSFRTLGRYFT